MKVLKITGSGITTSVNRTCLVCRRQKTKLGVVVVDAEDFSPENGWPSDLGPLFEAEGDVWAPICRSCQVNVLWAIREKDILDVVCERILEATNDSPSFRALREWVKWWKGGDRSISKIAKILGKGQVHGSFW